MCNIEADNAWSKTNLKKIFSKETIMLHASGDGGRAPGRCCRLCGSDRGLRRFGESYVWEGVEERYDQLLHQCFGVKVKNSGSMICDGCVHRLRNAERFKALVHAAFDKTPSEFSVSSNYSIHQAPTVIIHHPNPRAQETKQSKMSIHKSKESLKKIELQKYNIINPKSQYKRIPKRRETDERDKKPFLSKGRQGPKRVNLFCSVCKQRYQMIVSNDECENFVCSRCRMNKGGKNSVRQRRNFAVPSNMKQQNLDGMHSRGNAKTKNRNCKLVIKVSRTELNERPKNNTHRKLYQEHRKGTIFNEEPCFCDVCGRKFNTKDLLDKHMWRVHIRLSTYQCQMCNDEFKTKKELQVHELGHRRLFKI